MPRILIAKFYRAADGSQPVDDFIAKQKVPVRAHYGNTLFRILYRRSEQFVVLLHIFEKHDGPVPDVEKQVARLRWSDFQERMDAKPRKQPTPIGRKAPPRRRL